MPIKSIIISLSLVLFISISLFAQKDKVLFTVDGEKVYTSEFVRVYEKNLSLIDEKSDKNVANYLNLFINYKLKLKEAYGLEMDTIPSYIREYTKYKNQLINPYLKDENLKKDLVKEAYNRLSKEVKASHILVKFPKNASPEDTLVAYNKIVDLRNRIIDGASFSEIAGEFSEDRSAKKNGGSLGYFTAFHMVYPFETAAYNTKVGSVSAPFRTRFGYHIVKVDDIRDSKGEVEVAHIMLKGLTPQNETKIQSIKEELDQGVRFETLAENYSQDGSSAKKGGVLPKFGGGRMVKSFEDVAFSLDEENEISQAFKTKFGWHIVKLIKKFPLKSFEEIEHELSKKVEKGQRAKIIGKSIVNKLMKTYSLSVNKELLNLFNKKDWRKNERLKSNETLLTLEVRRIPVNKLYEMAIHKSSFSTSNLIKQFKEEEVLSYYKEILPSKFPELRYTLKEYREGLLLFDLMQQKIWEKADKDSLGLVHFFNSNIDRYQWEERANLTRISSNSKEIVEEAKKLLDSGVASEVIDKQLSKTGLLKMKNGIFEKHTMTVPNGFNFELGISKIYKDKEQYLVYDVKEILKAQSKEINEVRGKAISDYQDFLEKEWLKKLHKNYNVKINNRRLKNLIKKYK